MTFPIQNNRWCSPLLAAVVSFCLLAGGCQSRRPNAPVRTNPEAAKAMAAFLAAHKFQGQPVLIEFGRVGCELSEKGLDRMIALHKRNAIPGLAFVRVEGATDSSQIRDYYEGKKPPFPVQPDPDAKLAKTMDATMIPCFMLVDRFGHIRYRGAYPEQLDYWARALLAETCDPGPDAPPLKAAALDAARFLAETCLPDLKGNICTLESRMGEKGLFVLFVDTSCPFAGDALKELPTVVQKLPAGINSVTINLGDSREQVRSFYATHKTGTPVVYDVTDKTTRAWCIQMVPTAMFITADKTFAYNGKAVWADMAVAIEDALHLPPRTVIFKAEGTGFG